MIAKKHRMKEREVKRAMKKWTPTHGRYFTIVSMPNKYTDNHRFAVVVSNKHTKSAVIRNAFRRSVYGDVSEFVDLPPRPWQRFFNDIVLITKKGIRLTKDEPEETDIARDLQINLTKVLR